MAGRAVQRGQRGINFGATQHTACLRQLRQNAAQRRGRFGQAGKPGNFGKRRKPLADELVQPHCAALFHQLAGRGVEPGNCGV